MQRKEKVMLMRIKFFEGNFILKSDREVKA